MASEDFDDAALWTALLLSGGLAGLAGVMACQSPSAGAVIAYAPINANHRHTPRSLFGIGSFRMKIDVFSKTTVEVSAT